MKRLFFTVCIAIYASNILAQMPDTTAITIQATAQEICDGEQVTLSVRKTWAVGDILCTDGTAVKREEYARSGKTAKGVVFWVSPDETHGWAVHLQEELYRQWSTVMVNIPGLKDFGATSPERFTDTAGYQNTKIIREYGDAVMFPAAYSVDFEQGWYLPAAQQALLLLAELPELNKSFAVIPGAMLMENKVLSIPGKYEDWRCWSSTEVNDRSVILGWTLTCRFGPKDWTDARTRSVCRFQINTI